jgi:hypothetical protein
MIESGPSGPLFILDRFPTLFTNNEIVECFNKSE